MRYLTDADYSTLIKTEHLDQIVGTNPEALLNAEKIAEAEIIGHIGLRYDMVQAFTDTAQFSTQSTYYGLNRIYYTEGPFIQTATYSPGDRVSYNEVIYINLGTSSQVIPTNKTYWAYLTEDNALYYAKLPNNKWDMYKVYNANDVVWWHDRPWTCLKINKSHMPDINLVSDYNGFDLDNNISIGYNLSATELDYSIGNSSAYWVAGTTYSFINEMPENGTYWIKGDNRNKLLTMHLIDICLYHLHSRVNPRNIPDLRKERYDGNGPNQVGGSVGWLKKVGEGIVHLDIDEIIPLQGGSVMFGSLPKHPMTW